MTHLLISASKEAAVSNDILVCIGGASTDMAPCAGSDKRPPVVVTLEIGTPILQASSFSLALVGSGLRPEGMLLELLGV